MFLMKKKEIYNSSVNEKEKKPYFHNILPDILNTILKKRQQQSALYLFTIANAYVSPYGVVFKNGKVISQSIYKSSNYKIWNNLLSFWNKRIKNKVRVIQGDCLVICHSWYQNYYHWLIEITPRLFLMKDDLSNKKLIIHENISKFHLEILSKFNFKEIIFINDDELLKCESISFTSFPNFYLNQHINISTQPSKIIELNINSKLMKEMKLWFQNKNPLLNESDKIKNNLYISRKKAGYRKILNEMELEKILDNNEFEKVFLEDYSFNEQIMLLNNAKIVISIHGAGLANILFMKSKSHVINLISEHHHEFCYMTIADVAGVNYTHINCTGVNLENPAYNDITVDLNLIENVLNAINS